MMKWRFTHSYRRQQTKE